MIKINRYKFMFNHNEELSLELDGEFAFFASFLPMIIETELNYYFENTDFCKIYEGVENLSDSQLLNLSNYIKELSLKQEVNFITIYCYNAELNKYEQIYDSNINILRAVITNQKHYKLESDEKLSTEINQHTFLVAVICNRE